LELFYLEDQDDTASEHSQAQLCAIISTHAVSGTEGPKTMRMQGMMQGIPISILIDSGSSYTFLSDSWATKLSGLSLLTCSLGVQVANGARLCCSHYIADGIWQMGGYMFSGDIRLLPLTHYDMIIGMDWLEAHSPMQVHWKHKWMSIPY
jgi:hypothetical protein